MKARILAMSVLLGMLVGCTDTADSISREYRNQINESLDAMMLVTDEATAQQMTMRVFKPMADRFKEIDRRLGLIRMNRTKKEFNQSNALKLFSAELSHYRKRYEAELTRLRTLNDQLIQIEQNKAQQEGVAFDPKDACKVLQQICAESGTLAALKLPTFNPKIGGAAITCLALIRRIDLARPSFRGATMKARILVMSVLLGMLVGCTDTADSISREYRNQINESLDAMMLVTDEATAQQMTLRVFKPMADRFKEIDRRLGLIRMNRTKKDFAIEFTTSDSANMYISEVYINRGRYRLEVERLKDLTKREIQAEREKHAKAGGDQPFNEAEVCKSLRLATPEAALASLDAQLNPTKTPAMFGLLNEMNAWKLDQTILDEMNSRRKKFNIPLGELK